MQSILNKILEPYKTVNDIFPSDTDLKQIKAEIREFIRHESKDVSPIETPYLLNVCGLPASGKTYLCQKIKQEKSNLLYISFDNIMESLPSYLSEYTKSKVTAFEKWEVPARFIGYQILKNAVKRKVPILFEHSNATPHHIDLYEKIKTMGYSVDIRYIEAPVELILPRLSKRERFFPEDRAKERSVLLDKIMPQYAKIATTFEKQTPWREQ